MPKRFFFVLIIVVAVTWIAFSFCLTWHGRPGVFSAYTFGQAAPLVLYIGSSPPRRTEFYLDFTTPANGHYAPLNPFRSTDLVAVTSQVFFSPLFYRTGSVNSTFNSHTSHIISERTLVDNFDTVDFCNGYIFVPGAHSECHSNHKLLSLNCGDVPLATCQASSTVFLNNGSFVNVPTRVSATSKWHILPSIDSNVWNYDGENIIHVAPDNPGQNITLYTSGVEFSGDTIILSLWMLEASFRHSKVNGSIDIYRTVSDDDNTEALLYSVAIIFAFAYWVHVSRKVSGFLYRVGVNTNDDTGGQSTDDILTLIQKSIPSALIANISLSLAIASIFSSISGFSHAHIFLPVEANIIIGSQGDYYSSFWRFLYPIYQCASCFVVLAGCLFIYGVRSDNKASSIISSRVQWVYDKGFGNSKVDTNDTCRYLLPALRYCFELQLLNAAFTTVPPPAGTAFRLAMSGFISIALQCIFGRDALFIFDFKKPNSSQQYLICFFVFVVASISLFYNTILMMAPLLWATNVVSLEHSLGVSACFLVTLTSASFVIALSTQRLLNNNAQVTQNAGFKKFY